MLTLVLLLFRPERVVEKRRQRRPAVDGRGALVPARRLVPGAGRRRRGGAPNAGGVAPRRRRFRLVRRRDGPLKKDHAPLLLPETVFSFFFVRHCQSKRRHHQIM